MISFTRSRPFSAHCENHTNDYNIKNQNVFNCLHMNFLQMYNQPQQSTTLHQVSNNTFLGRSANNFTFVKNLNNQKINIFNGPRLWSLHHYYVYHHRDAYIPNFGSTQEAAGRLVGHSCSSVIWCRASCVIY